MDFKYIADPANWPNVPLLPAALLRIELPELEHRLGFALAPFQDQDGRGVGLAMQLNNGYSAAVLKYADESTPSIYLPPDEVEHPEQLQETLKLLRLDQLEVIYRQNDFSFEDIQADRHIIPTPDHELIEFLQFFRSDSSRANSVISQWHRHVQNFSTFRRHAHKKWLRHAYALQHFDRLEVSKLPEFSIAAHFVGDYPKLELRNLERRNNIYPLKTKFFTKEVEALQSDTERWFRQGSASNKADDNFYLIQSDGNIFFTTTNNGVSERNLDLRESIRAATEFIWSVRNIGELLINEPYELLIQCNWKGLKGRQLSFEGSVWESGYFSQKPSVESLHRQSAFNLRANILESVKSITLPLSENFEFFRPPRFLYTQELMKVEFRWG